MKTDSLRVVSLLAVLPMALTAQVSRERDIPLRPWPAPQYWQPTEAEAHANGALPDAAGTLLPQAQSPANSLVFVGMTPCRVVDTRTGQGFTGAFGSPSLAGQASRTFPIQSSPNCTIPAIAQAYSFNVTVVPPGFLGFITVYPTGQPKPNASTLNDSTGLILANAAIVPAGTNGSVDVFANNATDLIIDINGYYAPQSGITLAQGSAGAPSLSFSGDAGTGMFSSAAGTLNFSTGGTNRLTVRADGDLDLAGNIRKGGTLFLHNKGDSNTGVGLGALAVNAGNSNTASGSTALTSNTTGVQNTASGNEALTRNTTGGANTASGSRSLAFNTTGVSNNASGYSALYNNTTGYQNAASGAYALFNNTTGGVNTALGYYAGVLLTTGNYNIMIGNEGVAAEANTIRIGDSHQNRAFISGIRAVWSGADAVPVVIDSAGQLGTGASSRRFKTDIQDIGQDSSDLMKLRPVSFHYIQHPTGRLEYGLIAEEVAEVYPDLVVREQDGQIETVQYQKLTPMLLNEVQKLHRQNQQMQSTIQQLEATQQEVQALKAMLAELLAVKDAGKQPEK